MSFKISQGFKPISISLSPNVERDDIRLVLKLIFQPWLWRRGKTIEKLENEFKEYLAVKYAFSFNSGRSALFAILRALDMPKESEVLLQAFTCNAAVNPVLWLNLTPKFIDCDQDSFNLDFNDLEGKIGKNSKVLMVQHTFGLPADMEKAIKIAQEKGLILIEDCAHSLGAEYKSKKVGTFGKAAFFSFSRDKIISSVYGGMAVTNDDSLAEKIKKFQKEFGYPSYFWVFQQLLHPILLNFVILPIYNFLNLGKIFLVVSQYLHILSKAVHWKEKRGKKPAYFPRALPNALAEMALHQFKKLDKFYIHRRQISEFYCDALKNTSFKLPEDGLPATFRVAMRAGSRATDVKPSFLRFTIKHERAREIIWNAWNKENILIGDWYTSPIAPFDTKLDEMKYELGECPNAEKLAKIILNLPTHINISAKDCQRIVDFLKNK